MLVTGPGRWQLSEAPVFQLFAPPVEARINASKYKKILQTLFRVLVSSQGEYLFKQNQCQGIFIHMSYSSQCACINLVVDVVNWY